MLFTVLDKHNNVKSILTNDNFQSSVESYAVLNASYTQEVGGLDEVEIEIKNTTTDTVNIDEGDYLLYKDDRGNLREFVVDYISENITYSEGYKVIIKASLSIIELKFNYLDNDLKKERLNLSGYMQKLIKGTRFSLGYIESSAIKTLKTDESMLFLDNFEALTIILNTFDVELSVSYEANDDMVVSRKINLFNKLGSRIPKRLYFDRNMESLSRQVNVDNIRTAIVPYTYGEDEELITIKDVEFKISNGDPFDKPLGQIYIQDPVALLEYGRRDSKDNPLNNFITMEIDTEEPETLAKLGWMQLARYSSPKVDYAISLFDVYRSTGNEDYSEDIFLLGDDIIVHDDLYGSDISAQTRVLRIVEDLLEPENTDIELGDSSGGLRLNGEETPPEIPEVEINYFSHYQSSDNRHRIFFYFEYTGAWWDMDFVDGDYVISYDNFDIENSTLIWYEYFDGVLYPILDFMDTINFIQSSNNNIDKYKKLLKDYYIIVEIIKESSKELREIVEKSKEELVSYIERLNNSEDGNNYHVENKDLEDGNYKKYTNLYKGEQSYENTFSSSETSKNNTKELMSIDNLGITSNSEENNSLSKVSTIYKYIDNSVKRNTQKLDSNTKESAIQELKDNKTIKSFTYSEDSSGSERVVLDNDKYVIDYFDIFDTLKKGDMIYSNPYFTKETKDFLPVKDSTVINYISSRFYSNSSYREMMAFDSTESPKISIDLGNYLKETGDTVYLNIGSSFVNGHLNIEVDEGVSIVEIINKQMTNDKGILYHDSIYELKRVDVNKESNLYLNMYNNNSIFKFKLYSLNKKPYLDILKDSNLIRYNREVINTDYSIREYNKNIDSETANLDLYTKLALTPPLYTNPYFIESYGPEKNNGLVPIKNSKITDTGMSIFDKFDAPTFIDNLAGNTEVGLVYIPRKITLSLLEAEVLYLDDLDGSVLYAESFLEEEDKYTEESFQSFLVVYYNSKRILEEGKIQNQTGVGNISQDEVDRAVNSLWARISDLEQVMGDLYIQDLEDTIYMVYNETEGKTYTPDTYQEFETYLSSAEYTLERAKEQTETGNNLGISQDNIDTANENLIEAFNNLVELLVVDLGELYGNLSMCYISDEDLEDYDSGLVYDYRLAYEKAEHTIKTVEEEQSQGVYYTTQEEVDEVSADLYNAYNDLINSKEVFVRSMVLPKPINTADLVREEEVLVGTVGYITKRDTSIVIGDEYYYRFVYKKNKDFLLENNVHFLNDIFVIDVVEKSEYTKKGVEVVDIVLKATAVKNTFGDVILNINVLKDLAIDLHFANVWDNIDFLDSNLKEITTPSFKHIEIKDKEGHKSVSFNNTGLLIDSLVYIKRKVQILELEAKIVKGMELDYATGSFGRLNVGELHANLLATNSFGAGKLGTGALVFSEGNGIHFNNYINDDGELERDSLPDISKDSRNKLNINNTDDITLKNLQGVDDYEGFDSNNISIVDLINKILYLEDRIKELEQNQ